MPVVGESLLLQLFGETVVKNHVHGRSEVHAHGGWNHHAVDASFKYGRSMSSVLGVKNVIGRRRMAELMMGDRIVIKIDSNRDGRKRYKLAQFPAQYRHMSLSLAGVCSAANGLALNTISGDRYHACPVGLRSTKNPTNIRNVFRPMETDCGKSSHCNLQGEV